MKRIVIAAVLVALGASAAVAGPIEDRQQLMKNVQAATKDGAGLARGAVPFDAAKVKAVLNVYIDASAKLPGLFPVGSDKGAKNSADPKIWSDTAGFKAEAAKFGADAKAGLTAADADSFKVAFTKITADCTSCHGTYRLKQQ